MVTADARQSLPIAEGGSIGDQIKGKARKSPAPPLPKARTIMRNTYHSAPEVRCVAQDILRDHHTHLITNGVYVLYLFTEEAEKIKGKRRLGTARKVSGQSAYLALVNDPDAPRAGCNSRDGDSVPGKLLVSEFFLITIYQSFWQSRFTTDHQRRALVDHELSHCYSEEECSRQTGEPTGKVTLSLLGHDLEEFHAIAQRYGAWEPAISTFAKALRDGQPSLFDFDEPEPAQGTTVTLTTRQGSVTLSGEKLRQQAEKSKAERSGA